MADWNRIGRALGGFAAGYAGDGPQYVAALQRADQMKMIEEERKRKESQERQQSTEQRTANQIRMARQRMEQNPVAALPLINEMLMGIPGAERSPLGQIKQSILASQTTGVVAPGQKQQILGQAAQQLRALEDSFVAQGLLQPEQPKQEEEYTLAPGARRFRGGQEIAANPEPQAPVQPNSDVGKLTADYRAGLISERDFLASLEKLRGGQGGRTPEQVRRDQLEIQKLERDLGAPTPTPEQETQNRVNQEAEGQNLRMLSSLSEGAETRQLNLNRARDFLQRFESGSVSSGTAVSARDWMVPGKWSDQGRFNEEFNAFAEVAARQQLKASGETRPTDADVEGMKRAMFGVGRTPETNIQLLKEYIATVEADENLYQQLIEARRSNQLGNFVPDVRAGIPEQTSTPTTRTLKFNPATGRLE